MTDKELIIALENEVNGSDYHNLEDSDLLDLIFRLNAKIENLQRYIQEEKSKEVKEFAEKLKESNDFYDCIRTIGNVDKIDYLVNVIDNLVKEKVGEEYDKIL